MEETYLFHCLMFTMADRIRMQFRAEAYNTSNTAPFSIPYARICKPDFGILGTADCSRNLPLGPKPVF